jgi:hemin uptake protein HemP
MSDNRDPNPPPERDEPSPSGQLPVVDARHLFSGCREIWIEHDGVRYRLRITRRNRLILQK